MVVSSGYRAVNVGGCCCVVVAGGRGVVIVGECGLVDFGSYGVGASSCEVVVGSCEVVVGSCEVVVGSCEVVVGSCEGVVGSCEVLFVDKGWSVDVLWFLHSKWVRGVDGLVIGCWAVSVGYEKWVLKKGGWRKEDDEVEMMIIV